MGFTRYWIASAVILGLVAGPAVAQQDFSNVTIETTDLGGGLYMLEGAGGNLGLSVGADGAVLIDDQFAPLTEKIQAAIAKVTDKPVKFVINTHLHGDHTGGNENFGKMGAIVMAHENVRKRMSTERVSTLFSRTTPPAAPGALPVLTFSDNVTIHLNGQAARVIHVAHAHTDGDAIIHFAKADVIHMGDVLFNGMYPFIDVDSGGSIDGVIAAQDLVLGMAGNKTKLIPGHGPLADKAALKKSRAMLAEVRKRVKKLVDAGNGEDEAVAADPLKDLNGTWGKGFINGELMVRTAYRSLKKK